MLASCLLIVIASTGLADGAASAADAVTLSDGTVVHGQVLEATPRGQLVVLVRREWAKTNAPAWLMKWEADELPLVRRARRDRKIRLSDWRHARAGTSAAGGDPVVAGVDREIRQLSTLRPPPTVLMTATLARHEVRSVARRPEADARLLRLGWLAGLGGVETMSVDELKAALQFRGRLRADAPAWVDALLPLAPEPDDRWRARRAATELAAEPGLRFVRFRQLTLPETGPGSDPPPRNTTELLDSPAGRTAFESIQGINAFDGTDRLLDGVANRGRVGAIVSRLEFSVDSDAADAEATFWVRQESGRWAAIFTRKATARTDEPAGIEVRYPEGTPIRSALLVLESVQATPSSPETSQQRQARGSAAERALGRARAALDFDLAPLVLPVLGGVR
jgi:hypothetical protein